MRDEEIESLLRSVRPRGLPEPDRRQVIESILCAGRVRSRAWWARPIALWKAAAVFALSAAAMWAASWWRADANARDDKAHWIERQPSIASSIVRRTYLHVDPSVFRGRDVGPFHDGDFRTWRVLDQRVAGQASEEAR